MRLDETSTRIVRAAKAEAARCGKDGSSLAEALGRNPKYVYDRFSFKKDFSTRDLGKIADHLGITTQDVALRRLTRRFMRRRWRDGRPFQ